jgi:hypothetical protein
MDPNIAVRPDITLSNENSPPQPPTLPSEGIPSPNEGTLPPNGGTPPPNGGTPMMGDSDLLNVIQTAVNTPGILTSKTSSNSCAPEYNTVTYTVNGDAYDAARRAGIISDQVNTLLGKLGEGNSLSMCVKKKCPDGNYATNFGKLINSEQNLYGCLYLPDTTTSSDGKTSSTCKSGKTLSSYGVSVNNIPDMCVSLPQTYFPKLQ